MTSLGFSLSVGSVLLRGRAALDADAQTLVDAMSTTPSTTRQTLISDTIASLKDAGIWAELDEIWFFAAHNAADALLGWKRYKDCLNVNSVSFTADEGFTGNGSTSYLNTQFVPSTDGVNYTQDDNSFGFYSRTDSALTDEIDAGTLEAAVRVFVNPRTSTDQIRYSNNVDTNIRSDANSVPDSRGLFVTRRTASNDAQAITNGNLIHDDATPTTGFPSIPIFIGAINNAGVAANHITRQYSAAFIGASLTVDQQVELYDIIQAYLSSLGSSFDPPVLIDFYITSANVSEKRGEMIAEIWSGNGYPATGVDSTSSDVADPLDTSASNLLRVDQHTINMDDNAGSFVMANTPYVWYPAAVDDNGKLVIVGYGHTEGDWELGTGYANTIRALVEDGYTVAGFQMPDDGVAATHNTYPDPTASLNYLKFFAEPITRLINELEGGFSAIYMTGKSGGGWTTTLMAAIDERITKSVPVAGGLPLYYTAIDRDWEQDLPGLSSFDYQDLYAMAASSGRAQVQILNTNDSCCYNYDQYLAQPQFDRFVSDLAEEIGGSYSLVWDDTHSEHLISAFGITQILATFNG